MRALKEARFPLWEEYSYLVKFEKNGKQFGMYVYAENEDEAKKIAFKIEGDIEIIEVKREEPNCL